MVHSETGANRLKGGGNGQVSTPVGWRSLLTIVPGKEHTGPDQVLQLVLILPSRGRVFQATYLGNL